MAAFSASPVTLASFFTTLFKVYHHSESYFRILHRQKNLLDLAYDVMLVDYWEGVYRMMMMMMMIRAQWVWER